MKISGMGLTKTPVCVGLFTVFRTEVGYILWILLLKQGRVRIWRCHLRSVMLFLFINESLVVGQRDPSNIAAIRHHGSFKFDPPTHYVGDNFLFLAVRKSSDHWTWGCRSEPTSSDSYIIIKLRSALVEPANHQ